MTVRQCQSCKFDHPERSNPRERCNWPDSRTNDQCQHHKFKRGWSRAMLDGDRPLPQTRSAPVIRSPVLSDGSVRQQEPSKPVKKESSLKEVMIYLTSNEMDWLTDEEAKRKKAKMPRERYNRSAIIRETLDERIEREKQA